MDAAGFQWTLMTVAGAVLLVAVIAWAMMRNRASRGEVDRSERGTRELYEAEERAHSGEADGMP